MIGQGFPCSPLEAIGDQAKAKQGRNGLQHSSDRGKARSARSWLHKPVGAPTSGSRRLYKVQRQYHGISGNPRRYQTIDSRRFSSYGPSRHSCALAQSSIIDIAIYGRRLKEDEVTYFPLYPLPRTLLGSSHWSSAPFRAPQGSKAICHSGFNKIHLKTFFGGNRDEQTMRTSAWCFIVCQPIFPMLTVL